MKLRAYVGNVLLGADLFASAVLGGMPGETMSGRAGAAWLDGRLRGRLLCPLIDVTMWACRQYPSPRGHCVHAIAGDIARARAVIADDSRRPQ